MITLRCTKKLQKHLGVKYEPEDLEPGGTLGDWCGNLIFMPAGPPLILVTNERTLLSVILGHDADLLGELGRRVVALLRRLELPEEAVEREAFALRQIRVGKTKNRRVLGSMNEAVLQIEVSLFDERGSWISPELVEDILAESLYSMLDYVPPSNVARELLGGAALAAPARETRAS